MKTKTETKLSRKHSIHIIYANYFNNLRKYNLKNK